MILVGYDNRGPVPNHGALISGVPHLFVVHIMQGTLAGTDSWFHDPAAQVSAHLGHGKAGERYQWVDTALEAWAQAAYNGVAWSAEHEGDSGEYLTAEQCESLSVAIAAWHAATGQPIQRSTDPSVPGVIGHGELGVAGGDHPECPGQPVLDQLPGVIARALQIAAGGVAATPPPAAPAPSTEETDVDVPQLQSGSAGTAVECVQRQLNAVAGAGLVVDGQFGAKTTAAVEAYQTFWHVQADGVVGPVTWALVVSPLS